MINDDLPGIIADTLAGLGQHERAAMVRDNHPPAELHDDCTDSEGVFNEIDNLIDRVPQNTDRHTHVEGKRPCWHTRAQCLADLVRNIINERSGA